MFSVAALSERRKFGGRRPPLQPRLSLYYPLLSKCQQSRMRSRTHARGKENSPLAEVHPNQGKVVIQHIARVHFLKRFVQRLDLRAQFRHRVAQEIL